MILANIKGEHAPPGHPVMSRQEFLNELVDITTPHLENLYFISLCRAAHISKSSIYRWLRGETAPWPGYRVPVLAALRQACEDVAAGRTQERMRGHRDPVAHRQLGAITRSEGTESGCVG